MGRELGPMLIRSMKAGAFTPATLEELAAGEVVLVLRSMKAGAFTPATLNGLGESAAVGAAQ